MSKQPNCLIVGAGDYIGAAIAKRFAAGGFTVCLARRGGEKNAVLVAEIEAAGGNAYSYSLDAREENQVVACIDSIESAIGALDLVIFNVGGNVNFPLLETSERVFRKVWMMACLGGFLTAPPRVCAEGKATRLLHRQNLASAHSLRVWRVNSARRAFMSPIS